MRLINYTNKHKYYLRDMTLKGCAERSWYDIWNKGTWIKVSMVRSRRWK